MTDARKPGAVVEFTIFDRPYRLACEPDQKLLLEQAANEFKKRVTEMRDAHTGMGPESAAIISGINCIFELLEQRAASSWDVNDMKQKVKSLESRLDRCFYEQDNLF